MTEKEDSPTLYVCKSELYNEKIPHSALRNEIRDALLTRIKFLASGLGTSLFTSLMNGEMEIILHEASAVAYFKLLP